VNVNLIVIFKCVSLKYLNINISARAASVAVSGGHTGERRACLCVSQFCPIPIYKMYAELEKGGFALVWRGYIIKRNVCLGVENQFSAEKSWTCIYQWREKNDQTDQVHYLFTKASKGVKKAHSFEYATRKKRFREKINKFP